jgi:hypothetical protein
MKLMKKIWSAILLVSMLGLAGCPDDMVQKGGGAASEEVGGSSGD